MALAGWSTVMQNPKQKKLDKSLCDNDHLWLDLQQLPPLEPELTAAVVVYAAALNTLSARMNGPLCFKCTQRLCGKRALWDNGGRVEQVWGSAGNESTLNFAHITLWLRFLRLVQIEKGITDEFHNKSLLRAQGNFPG